MRKYEGVEIKPGAVFSCYVKKYTDGKDLQKLPINTLISYKNIAGEFKQGGSLCKSTDDYFIYQDLNTRIKKRVRFLYVKKFYVKINSHRISNLKSHYDKFMHHYYEWLTYHQKVTKQYSKCDNLIKEMFNMPCCTKYFFWNIEEVSDLENIHNFVKKESQSYIKLNHNDRKLLIELISKWQHYNEKYFKAVCDEMIIRKQLDDYLETIIPRSQNFYDISYEDDYRSFFLSNKNNPEFFSLSRLKRYYFYRETPLNFNISKGETKVQNFLINLQQEYLKQDIHLVFLREQSFSFCTYNRELRMDFLCFLITNDKMIPFVIEVDGFQHYFATNLIHIRDVLKQYYLEQLNIHLLRLAGKIDLQEITNFIYQIRQSDKVLAINKIEPELDILVAEKQKKWQTHGLSVFHKFTGKFRGCKNINNSK